MRMRTRRKMIAEKRMIVRLRAKPIRCSSGRRAAIARSQWPSGRPAAPAPRLHDAFVWRALIGLLGHAPVVPLAREGL
jgi:hypothetical protein